MGKMDKYGLVAMPGMPGCLQNKAFAMQSRYLNLYIFVQTSIVSGVLLGFISVDFQDKHGLMWSHEI